MHALAVFIFFNHYLLTSQDILIHFSRTIFGNLWLEW